MTTGAQRFGELRSLLQRPSPEAWVALCALIDEAPAAQAAEQLIPYALDHLRAWPDALRVATDAALDALSQDAVAAMSLRLARHLDTQARWIDEGCARALLAQPLSLRSLRLQGALDDESVGALAMSEALRGLTHLDLARAQLADAAVAALMRAPCAPNLTHLDLSWNNLRDGALRAIADAPLERLTTLHLEGGWATPEASGQLKRAAFCGQLTALSLGGRHVAGAIVGWLGWPSLRALDRAGFFASARRAALPTNALGDAPLGELALDGPLATEALDLRDNKIEGEVLERLAEVLLPPTLTELDLSSNPLREVGVAAIARRPLHQLTTLHLRAAHVDAEALRPLLSSQNLGALRALHLDHNQAEPTLAAALGEPLPCVLEELCVGYNRLTDEGVRALARNPALKGLRVLMLQECALSAEACRALAESPHLTGLRELWLSHNIIGDAGAAWLARGGWTGLEALHLWRCGVQDAGAEALARAPWGARLTQLDLTDNPIYQGGRDALAASAHLPDALRRRFVGPPPKRHRPLPGEFAT